MIDFLKRFFALRKLRKYKQNINFKEKLWLQLKPTLLQDNKIEQERKEIKNEKSKIKLPSWSKMLLVFLFFNFTLLEIFIGYVTIQSFTLAFAIGMMPDFTPLVTLIGLVAGETISYGAYCAKSKAENTRNGITYDSVMYQLKYNWIQQEKEQSNNDNAVG